VSIFKSNQSYAEFAALAVFQRVKDLAGERLLSPLCSSPDFPDSQIQLPAEENSEGRTISAVSVICGALFAASPRVRRCE
jgi:hypothetical protein